MCPVLRASVHRSVNLGSNSLLGLSGAKPPNNRGMLTVRPGAAGGRRLLHGRTVLDSEATAPRAYLGTAYPSTVALGKGKWKRFCSRQ